MTQHVESRLLITESHPISQVLNHGVQHGISSRMSEKQHYEETKRVSPVRHPNLASRSDPSRASFHHPDICRTPWSRHVSWSRTGKHHVQRFAVECPVGLHLCSGHVRTSSLLKSGQEVSPGNRDTEDRTARICGLHLHLGILPKQHTLGDAPAL